MFNLISILKYSILGITGIIRRIRLTDRLFFCPGICLIYRWLSGFTAFLTSGCLSYFLTSRRGGWHPVGCSGLVEANIQSAEPALF